MVMNRAGILFFVVDAGNQRRTMLNMAKKKSRVAERKARGAKRAPAREVTGNADGAVGAVREMTREEAKEWRARWQRVNEFHIHEIRNTTIEERWQQLNNIFGFALARGWVKPAADDELVAVRERWARLKSEYP